mgnify:CR=1 FL=1
MLRQQTFIDMLFELLLIIFICFIHTNLFFCHQLTDHRELNIKDNILSFLPTSTSTTCNINPNDANKDQPFHNKKSCQCNQHKMISCNTCKHISNDEIVSNKIIINPGDIIKYRDYINGRIYHYGTISCINKIQGCEDQAKIYIMDDRALSIFELIRLVLSYDSTITDPNKPVMKIMPDTNKLFEISFYGYKYGNILKTDLPINHPAHILTRKRKESIENFISGRNKSFIEYINLFLIFGCCAFLILGSCAFTDT